MQRPSSVQRPSFQRAVAHRGELLLGLLGLLDRGGGVGRMQSHRQS